jgi:D-alanyl-D-alanine carboxypeptidase
MAQMMPISALWCCGRVSRRWAFGLALILCVSSCAWVPKRQTPAQQQTALKSALNHSAQSVDMSNTAGYTVRVRARGKLVFAKDAGLASSDLHIPIDDQTIFELASLSKSFTALAVMQLQERGLIDLAKPLVRYMPDIPKSWGAITVHHLLSHQSGLPDGLNLWPRRQLNALDFKAMMKRLTAQPKLDFEPGRHAAYSNINYMLLAHLVEVVSGEPFAEYLKTKVFEPAGMKSSSLLRSAPEQVMQQALSYAEGLKIHGIDYALTGAINQKSSMEDLEKFVQALLTHRLVRAKTLDLMMMPHAVFEDGKRYGYGWYIGQLGGWVPLSTSQPAAAAGHTGRLGAYRSALYFNRERDFQFIMLSNGGSSTELLLAEFLKITRDALE